MLPLFPTRRKVSSAHHRFLFRPGTLVYATASAVVADARHIAFVDRRVVNVVNHGDIHVVHGAVVEKVSIVPAPAFIPTTKVAVAVVDSAVETDLGGPEAFIEDEPAAAPTPISRSPQKTD